MKERKVALGIIEEFILYIEIKTIIYKLEVICQFTESKMTLKIKMREILIGNVS